MSKRISKTRAKMLRDRELELQQLQREGKSLPKSERWKKKYLMQVKKQKGYFAYLAKRYKSHGHDKEIVDKFKELSR